MAITGQLTLNEVLILEVDADPSVSGVTAPIGSTATIDDKVNAKMWIKSGSGDTAWSILPRLANGTAFSTGSVIFADSSGFLGQNNAQLFWDNSNSRLGLGLTSPQSRLHLDAGTSNASAIKLTVGATTGQASTDGFEFGVDTSGSGEIRQRENSAMSVFTNNTLAQTITAAGSVVFGPSASPLWRTSSAGTDMISPHLIDVGAGPTSGSSYNYDTNGLGWLRSNGVNRIARAGFQLNTVVDTSGAETGGISILTKPAASIVTERLRITPNGTVIVGSAAEQDITGLGAIPTFQIQGLSAVQMAAIQYSADVIPPVFNLLKSRGTTVNSQGLVQNNDEVGRLQFRASDGVNFQAAASVRAAIDGTAAANSMPGRLSLQTTPSGATTPVERMLINSAGLVRVIDAVRWNRKIEDFTTQATAASTLTLTSASTGIQIFTGSTAGQIVKMPDATTLTVGATYEIRNTTINTIAVQDGAAGALDITPTTTGTTALVLTANGTAAGTWIVRSRFEPYAQEVNATGSTSIAAATYATVGGMTITPPAGTYMAVFSTSVTSANANLTAQIVLAIDTVVSLHTQRSAGVTNANPLLNAALSTNGIFTVNGSQAINAQWQRQGTGTISCTNRTFNIVRVG